MNYFLLGPEEGQKADWLNEEKKRVLSEHPDAEIHQIFVGDDKGEDLDAALSQQSLFSSFRFVIVKQYENRTARDTFDKAIISFLSLYYSPYLGNWCKEELQPLRKGNVYNIHYFFTFVNALQSLFH